MKKEHTPGPWNWYWRVEDGEISCGVVSERGYSVCRAPRYQTKEQWEADARLIAAAPELLEALRALLSVAPARAPAAGVLVGAEEKHSAAIKAARAAIAKATTEAP